MRESGIEALVQPFFTDMAEMYGQADLLVSRAGATTLCGNCRGRDSRPSLFPIPLRPTTIRK